jgi:hypothetical protein
MRFSTVRQGFVKYSNLLFFIGGFIFDALTLRRIDAVWDLVLQFVYLLFIVVMIDFQARKARGIWVPSPRVERWWHYDIEALHFVYGGLLSAYVIFYFKSSTFSRSAFFLLLVIVLMFANEMPQLRKAGFKMRLGLYALCIVSYLNYLLPVLIGRMGGWVFALAVLLSGWTAVVLVKRLARYEPNPKKAYWTLGWSPAVVLLLVVVFYVNRWIPPVPLSMQYAGIYHQVNKEGNRYQLKSIKWPWYQFWRSDDRPFLARPGDSIHCFVRVFAPSRFRNQIYLHWGYQPVNAKRFITSDRIPLSIFGGRGEGFRGYSAKTNYQPGHWRVVIEIEDGRALGEVEFDVKSDPNTDERAWKTTLM